MKQLIRITLLNFLFIYASNVFAAPYFTVTKSSDVSFPSEMLVAQSGLGDYIVTNVSGKAQTVHAGNLPTGFSVTTATGVSPANCGSSSLANNASCTLRLSYDSNSATTISQSIPTVCPTSQYITGCVYPTEKTSFAVVATPTNDMPTLSSASDTLLLAPGQTTTLTVTNTGPGTANNVQLNLPAQLNQYLESGAVMLCATVAAEHSCVFTIPMNGDLPTNTDGLNASVSASNASALHLKVGVDSGLVTVTSIGFTTPGTQAITVANQSVSEITGLDIDMGSGLSGVTQTSSTCGSTLASNASCTYSYQATASAYGAATMTVSYTQGVTDKTRTSKISVANTTVAINPNSENQGQTIIGNTTTGEGSFEIKNTGNFNWQAPTVTSSTADTWLTLNTNACASALAAGDSCTINYSINNPTGVSSVITASGSNISNTSQNFHLAQSITLGIESESAYQHLGYGALKVTNLTSQSQTLSNISAAPPSALASQVTLCNATGSNCAAPFAVSSCQNGVVLASGATCYFWYQANTETTLTSATTSSVAVSLTTSPAGPLSRTVNFTYDNALYVGGLLVAAGGYPTNNVAKWDGTNWLTLGNGNNNGTNDFTYALATLNGDLYAGGWFTSAGGNTANHIAKWNGSEWTSLNGGTNGAYVLGLVPLNGNLYVGGNFTVAGNIFANNVAQWNPNTSTWSPLDSGTNSEVLSLTSLGNNLVAGGQFIEAGGSPTVNSVAQWNGNIWSPLGTGSQNVGVVTELEGFNNTVYAAPQLINPPPFMEFIAQWNGSSWLPMGTGVNGVVYAFASLNNILYVGGQFTQAGNVGANYIAQWDGNNWSTLGEGVGGPQVSALAFVGNVLYVGGNFSTAGNIAAYSIASWDGNTWATQGYGLSGTPYAMTAAPSLSLS